MYYEYRQNNSGGSFDINNEVSVLVIIEADDVESANTKAEEVGIYFNGIDEGIDCECCGDRWHSPWSSINMEEYTTLGYKIGKFMRDDHITKYRDEFKWDMNLVLESGWESSHSGLTGNQYGTAWSRMECNDIEDYVKYQEEDNSGWVQVGQPWCILYEADGTKTKFIKS